MIACSTNFQLVQAKSQIDYQGPVRGRGKTVLIDIFCFLVFVTRIFALNHLDFLFLGLKVDMFFKVFRPLHLI